MCKQISEKRAGTAVSHSCLIVSSLPADLEALSKEEEFCGLHVLQSHGPAWHAVPPV